jgi:NAD(P)-dependent dehydrogenase (short-subunit alcohol dehydrogenase family)
MTGRPAEDRYPAEFLERMFSLQGRVAVVTGATGVLGSEIARGLAMAGATVGVLGRRAGRASEVVAEIEAGGGVAAALSCDVLDAEALQSARDDILRRWGGIHILVNAAGGNAAGATTDATRDFFKLDPAAIREAVDLNLLGTALPCQIFGAVMAEGDGGAIVNVSSMTVGRALTRVAGYSAGKAAVENFTRWLAVDFSTRGLPMRVNAVAPGFFVAEQNRSLLTEPDGSLTPRGRAVIDGTPMGRFGVPEDLVGAVLWLCSPASAFVTGVTLPVDGGFSAFSGV